MTCVYLHTHILHFTIVSIVTEEVVKGCCTTGSCKMMFPINCLVCLLITTRIIRLENIMHVSLGFTVYSNYPCPRAPPLSQVVIEHKSQAT